MPRFLIAPLALALAACGSEGAPDAPDTGFADDQTNESLAPVATADALGLNDPFARAAPAGGVSAVFLQIENATALDETLVAARTDAAGRVEIHRTQEGAGGLSEMVEVEGGLLVPAGETVTLEPGGLHVMLLDLQRDLAEGDTLDVEMEFSSRGTVTARVPVRGLGR